MLGGVAQFLVLTETVHAGSAPASSQLVISVDHGLSVVADPDEPLPTQRHRGQHGDLRHVRLNVEHQFAQQDVSVNVAEARAPAASVTTSSRRPPVPTTAGDADTTNSTASNYVTSPGRTDISIKASVPSSRIGSGQPVTLTYSLTNDGDYDYLAGFSDQYWWYDRNTPKGDKVLKAPLPMHHWSDPGPAPNSAFCEDYLYLACALIPLAPHSTRSFSVIVQFDAVHAGKSFALHPIVYQSDSLVPDDVDESNNETTLTLQFADASSVPDAQAVCARSVCARSVCAQASRGTRRATGHGHAQLHRMTPTHTSSSRPRPPCWWERSSDAPRLCIPGNANSRKCGNRVMALRRMRAGDRIRSTAASRLVRFCVAASVVVTRGATSVRMSNGRPRALAAAVVTTSAMAAAMIWVPAASAAVAPDLGVWVGARVGRDLGDHPGGVAAFGVNTKTVVGGSAPASSQLVISVDHGLKVAEYVDGLPSNCAVTGSTITCDLSDDVQNTGAEQDFTVQVAGVNTLARNDKVNVTAVLTTAGDSDASNDSSSTYVTSAGQVDVSVKASAPPARIVPGKPVTLTYLITNNGDYDYLADFSDKYEWRDILTPKGDKIITAPFPPDTGLTSRRATGTLPGSPAG